MLLFQETDEGEESDYMIDLSHLTSRRHQQGQEESPMVILLFFTLVAWSPPKNTYNTGIHYTLQLNPKPSHLIGRSPENGWASGVHVYGLFWVHAGVYICCPKSCLTPLPPPHTKSCVFPPSNLLGLFPKWAITPVFTLPKGGWGEG